MIKVKDVDGREVKGLYRAPNGTLIVNDGTAYNRYQSQLQDKRRISSLEEQIKEMRDMMGKLLNDKK